MIFNETWEADGGYSLKEKKKTCICIIVQFDERFVNDRSCLVCFAGGQQASCIACYKNTVLYKNVNYSSPQSFLFVYLFNFYYFFPKLIK